MQREVKPVRTFRTLLALTMVLLLAAAFPALAEHGRQSNLDGTVTSINSADGSFTLADKRGGTYTVVTSHRTEFKSKGAGGLRVGDRVKVKGVNLGYGRVLATRIELKARSTGLVQPGPGSVTVTVSPSAGSTVFSLRPTLSATFSGEVTLQQMLVNGVDVTTQVSWRGRSLFWTPPYDLSLGTNNVRLSFVEQATGALRSAAWSFQVAGSGTGVGWLQVTSPLPGQTVGPYFTVYGRTSAYSSVHVETTARTSILGLIQIKTGKMTFHGQADAQGNFAVPVNVSTVPPEAWIDLRVWSTDTAGRDSTNVNLSVLRSQ